ncbi:MAG TPA: hypothetical protein VHX59_25190 [Mycobacteriales bacterium]|nr:hypothetical protein [Mycobacteriales bacterium]
MAESTADPLTRRRVERWFVRRGVPHFIVDYTASGDIFTRAAPLLAVIFLGEMGTAFHFGFGFWGNVLAFLGALAIVLTTIVTVNRLRHRRLWTLPNTVGPIELAAFLIVPPLIPLVIRDQWHKTIGTFIGNALFLCFVYLTTSYALLPILRWAFVQAWRQLKTIANLMAKSLPLMLVFSMFIFVNADTWGLAGQIPCAFLAIAVGIVVLVGSLFIVLRVPQELHSLDSFHNWAEVAGSAATTPAAELPVAAESDLATDPLARRERTNLGLVLFFNQAVQVFLVTCAIGIFYVIFGIFVIQPATVKLWTGHVAHPIWRTFSFLGGHAFLSRELIITAIFVAAVSGLQFAVAAVTDSTYREEFHAGLTRELRTAMAVRHLYRAAYLTERKADSAAAPKTTKRT